MKLRAKADEGVDDNAVFLFVSELVLLEDDDDDNDDKEETVDEDSRGIIFS
jgi:hypothetical protein